MHRHTAGLARERHMYDALESSAPGIAGLSDACIFAMFLGVDTVMAAHRGLGGSAVDAYL